MLATLGDLVDDIVVRIGGPLHVASDTPARIARRRGGSAANVAAAAAALGYPVRFIGQVGDDAIGNLLVNELASTGVDTSIVRMSGSSGTIVVLVDETGERSMLTDRRACLELVDPEPSWLDGVTTLHVPLYSLTETPLRETATTMIEWAHERDVSVAIDASSAAVIRATGTTAVRAQLEKLRPSVLFANADEARELDIQSAVGDSITVVKRGPEPALIYRSGHQDLAVSAMAIPRAQDTTGAGDAFAAGFLAYNDDDPSPEAAWLRDPAAACRAGHQAAAEILKVR